MPEPALDDLGPPAKAHEIVDCIEDELASAREHIGVAEDMLDDLRSLLDSGELREKGSRPEDD